MFLNVIRTQQMQNSCALTPMLVRILLRYVISFPPANLATRFMFDSALLVGTPKTKRSALPDRRFAVLIMSPSNDRLQISRFTITLSPLALPPPFPPRSPLPPSTLSHIAPPPPFVPHHAN